MTTFKDVKLRPFQRKFLAGVLKPGIGKPGTDLKIVYIGTLSPGPRWLVARLNCRWLQRINVRAISWWRSLALGRVAGDPEG